MDDQDNGGDQYNKAYIEWIEALHKEQIRQGELLERISQNIISIKNMMLFFTLLVILAIVIQGCTVFLTF